MSAALFGLRIIESPLITAQPRMRLSPECEAILTPEDAAKENQWLREFFGTYMPYYVMGDTVAMHPTTRTKLAGAVFTPSPQALSHDTEAGKKASKA